MKNAFGIGVICLAFTAVASTSLSLFAQDKKGPLAELPTKPGAHVEKIKALGDNEWLNLGAPAADPKWGKARGSSWGAKALILAPDKRADDVIPFADSEELASKSGATLIEVGNDHRLADPEPLAAMLRACGERRMVV